VLIFSNTVKRNDYCLSTGVRCNVFIGSCMSVLLSFDNLLIRMYLLLQCSLASYITDDEIRKGILFPSVSRCVLRLHTFIQNFHPIYSIILNYDEALTSTHKKKNITVSGISQHVLVLLSSVLLLLKILLRASVMWALASSAACQRYY
jgi:hypothetical protein